MGGEPWIEEILIFWFGKPDDPDFNNKRKKWFERSDTFDQEIRDRFLPVYEHAVGGGLPAWRDKAQSSLALLLTLDQFPRNMFRESPRAFIADPLAREIARDALDKKHDQTVPLVHRAFFYLPFEHSETLEDQERSVALFRAMSTDGDHDEGVDYAIRHYDVIKRFGRFPHRNAVLDRTSTTQELEFLKQNKKGF